MAVDAALRRVLLGTPAVVSKIGYGSGNLRFVPMALTPNTQLPAVVYQRVDRVSDNSHSRTKSTPISRYQITIWDKTFSGARELAALIQDAIEGYRGEGDGTVIKSVLMANEIDRRDEDTGYTRVIQDYLINHEG